MATEIADLKAIVHKEDDGYWAEVPDLPGCFTQGDSLDELVVNLEEAVIGWFEADAIRNGRTFTASDRRCAETRTPVRVLEFA